MNRIREYNIMGSWNYLVKYMAEKHWNNDNQSMIDLNTELVKSQLSGTSVWLFMWNEKKQKQNPCFFYYP